MAIVAADPITSPRLPNSLIVIYNSKNGSVDVLACSEVISDWGIVACCVKMEPRRGTNLI